MKYRVSIPLHIALTLLLVSPALAQDGQAARERFDRAMASFQQGQYEQAASELTAVAELTDAPQLRPEALYWLGRVRLAQHDSFDAALHFDGLIRSYPEHPRVADARYYRARAHSFASDHELALVQFEEFIGLHPDSPYVANAYYWSGEALLALGHRDRAARLFQTVINDYPTSFRVEAAGYRLALIELSEREQQLQRLLQWSHEEHLRTIASFRTAQSAYEDALAAYRDGAAGDLSADDREVAELRAEIARLVSQLTVAQGQLAQMRATRGDAMDAEGDLAYRLRLAEIKEQALRVKEQLLRELDSSMENAQ